VAIHPPAYVVPLGPDAWLLQEGADRLVYVTDTPCGVCRDCGGIVTGYHNPADDRYYLTTCVTGTEADGDDVEFTDPLSSYVTTRTEPAEPRLLLINRAGDWCLLPIDSPPTDVRWRHLYRHARRLLRALEAGPPPAA
jgi:hypothetical protein